MWVIKEQALLSGAAVEQGSDRGCTNKQPSTIPINKNSMHPGINYTAAVSRYHVGHPKSGGRDRRRGRGRGPGKTKQPRGSFPAQRHVPAARAEMEGKKPASGEEMGGGGNDPRLPSPPKRYGGSDPTPNNTPSESSQITD